MNNLGRMSFCVLWATGILMNTVIVAFPLIFIPHGKSVFWDPGFLTVLFVLMLWVGCDLTVEKKDISHYSRGKVHFSQMKWFPYVSSFLILLGIWIAVLDFAAHPPSSPLAKLSIGWLGFGIALVGLLVRFIAIGKLGPYFSEELVVQNFQPLVTSGLYQYIRHPSYCGLLLISFGIPTILESLWGFIYCAVFIVPIVIYRINIEEDILLKGYGVLYNIYQRRTKRLIPHLY